MIKSALVQNDSLTNRNDPTTVGLYQDLADLISVFWELHKERVEKSGLPRIVLDGTYDTPFSALGELNSGHKNVMRRFEYSLGWTLSSSWALFIRLNGTSFNTETDQELQQILRLGHFPDWITKYIDPYVVELAHKADKQLQIKNNERGVLQPYSIDTGLAAGINAGAEFSTQLKGLFGEDFRPALLMTVAKTSLKKLSETRHGIGSHRADGQQTQAKFHLLDESALGLNKSTLRALGLGSSIGCPAALKPSPKTQRFMEAQGIPNSGKPMLDDFSSYIDAAYDEYLGDWFDSLPETQRETLDQEMVAIMTGVRRAEAVNATILIRENQTSPRKESL